MLKKTDNIQFIIEINQFLCQNEKSNEKTPFIR